MNREQKRMRSTVKGIPAPRGLSRGDLRERMVIPDMPNRRSTGLGKAVR